MKYDYCAENDSGCTGLIFLGRLAGSGRVGPLISSNSIEKADQITQLCCEYFAYPETFCLLTPFVSFGNLRACKENLQSEVLNW